ncbi:MBL fold metallo-hydrolase [Aquibacillus koreensis]|uniref:MBL fold metallo-hydrolase n=1 Tax=Aquibacillus koreensis TaxID=279446 RepID=A0A9X3WKT6_9BACI|nr:MBL fold metallo-hydrolase [Aquibacillus koreensis]MCT2537490.1 MBL fold metallo-hydrolase [Aquibacillus koreensis]MDC3418936.1 MBL fold metallo-hydrolase [Aquibacillus koreensis]
MSAYKTVTKVSFFEHFFPVNCYLVEEEHELTLIDAALPFSAKRIQKVAKLLGKPITKILLTHGHEDHVGSLDKLKEHLPELTVYISERDSHLLAGDRSLFPSEPETPIRGGVPKNVKTKADVWVKDGDQIGSLLAIATPGHTPGSMSFLDVRNNCVIAGDAFQTKGALAVSGDLQWSFPFPALATWNKEKAIESAQKLLAYNPTKLFVGHGPVILEPETLMEQAILRAEHKLTQ